MGMEFRLAGRTYRGRAVEVRTADATPADVADALGLAPADPLAVVDDDPPPPTRLLAAAARSRGEAPPNADRIAALERELAACDGEIGDDVDLPGARERAATAGDDVERLRERVASYRGRLGAARDAGRDPSVAEAALAEAARELAEAETERVAAEQALADARGRARERRDAGERRLRLRDALANRRREARAALASAVYPAFAAAARDLPGDASPGDAPEAFDGDRVTAAIAAVAVAERAEPIVLGVRRFESAEAAATRLGVRVARL